VPPPPPPAVAVQHPKPHHATHKKTAVAKKPVQKTVPAKHQPPGLLAGGVSTAGSPSSFLPALLIVAFGVALALLAVGISFMPASAVPAAVGLRIRLERNRQTIMVLGLAIGIACALVGILTALLGG
jgi:hypothetical protein